MNFALKNHTRLEIAPHLIWGEMMCRCGCGICVAHVKLLNAWEAVRLRIGSPIKVVSGYRCHAHNQRIGGSPGSQHIFGKAFDLDFGRGLDPMRPESFELFLECGFRGIGRGFNAAGRMICHLDARKEPSFWRYTSSGISGDPEATEAFIGWTNEKSRRNIPAA